MSGTFVRGFLLSIFISEIFERKKIKIQKHFWVFENDSLGIYTDYSYDGRLPFWTKSWPTGEKGVIKSITSGTDRTEKIFQVVNKGGRSFEEFIYTCAFFWHFSAKEVNFVHIFSCGHGFKKLSTRTPPQISRRIFWCNKNFFGLIFYRKFYRKWTGNDDIVDSDRVFRLGRTYTTYIWRVIITEITVIEVMALKC